MNKLVKNLFFITLFFTVTQAQAQFGKEWLTCNTTTDCLKVNGICGRKDAINKKFIKDFEIFAQKMSIVSSCAELTQKEKTHNELAQAQCIAGQCRLEEPTVKPQENK